MAPPAKRRRQQQLKGSGGGGGTGRPPGGRAGASGSGAGSELRRALAWLNSYPKVSRWMEQYDIVDLVERGGGICRVENFLPDFVAEGALHLLQRLPSGRWRPTEAAEDYTHNNISHAFWSIKGGMAGGGDIDGEDGGSGSGSGGLHDALEALLRAFTLLLPEQLNAFSVARYDQGHHIAPHDDRAYTPVRLDTGEVVSCSRDLTVVYYLTKDWEESMGGALIDLEARPEGEASEDEGEEAQQQRRQRQQLKAGGREGAAAAGAAAAQQRGRAYVPLFNSAVFFRVPRYHSVTPLTTTRPRYSVFGWFLQPGKLYDLFSGEGEEQEHKEGAAQAQLPAPLDQERQTGAEEQPQQQQQQQQQRAAAPAGKLRKKRRQQAGQLAGEAGGGEGEGVGVPQCKLAQRLLARLAGKAD